MEAEPESMERFPAWAARLVLVVLMGISFYLAATRFLTVDDFQNVYMARVLATGRAKAFFTNGELYLLPLGWVTQFLNKSGDIIQASRLLFAAWFWFNLCLLTKACGVRIFSRRGLFTLLLVALLAPLWINGYEVRHDNMLITWILCFWILLGRPNQGSRWSYGFMGLLTVLVQFSNFKSLAYWVPCTFLAFCFPNPIHGRSRFRLMIQWLLGILAGLMVAMAIYVPVGGWESMVQGVGLFSRDVKVSVRFSPFITLKMLFDQAPLLVAAFVAFFWICATRIRNEGTPFFSWDTWAPEFAFASIGLLAYFANPNPYSYNLLLLVPQLVIAVARLSDIFVPLMESHPEVRQVVWILLALGQGIPFASAISKHFEYGNGRQLKLVALAEIMTDPTRDRVYDAVGMVPTRDSIMYHWVFNSMGIHGFSSGEFPEITEALKNNPPAVILPNFRITWLPESGMAFLHAHYLPLALDFMVLGARIQGGTGAFECIHGGRYALVVPANPGERAMLDGLAVGPDPIYLAPGIHSVNGGGGEVFVVWVGPTLTGIPTVGPADAKSMDVLGI